MYRQQLKALLDFVANINAVDKSGDLETVIKKLLDVLAEGFKLDQLFFVHQMTPSGLPEYTLRNLPQEKCEEYKDYYYQYDPFRILAGTPGEPRVRSWLKPYRNVMRLPDLIDYSTFVATEYYNDFWRPQNIDNELGAFLVNDGRVLGYLGLYRKRGRGFLWEEETALMNLVSPYVTLTLENINLHRQRQIKELATSLVEKNASVGLMVLDLNMKVLFQNRPAAEYCQALGEDPFATPKDVLTAPGSMLHQCRSILNRIKNGVPDLPCLMEKEVMASASGKYTVQTYYFGNNHQSFPHQNVFVIKMEPVDSESVRHQLRNHPFWGLTHREGDIVGCLFDGLTNKEIADNLYISEITVKKHIQNVCGKLGVKTRTAIISKILKSKSFI